MASECGAKRGEAGRGGARRGKAGQSAAPPRQGVGPLQAAQCRMGVGAAVAPAGRGPDLILSPSLIGFGFFGLSLLLLRKVPWVDPSSLIMHVASARQVMVQWNFETLSWLNRTVHGGSRPVLFSSFLSGYFLIWPLPRVSLRWATTRSWGNPGAVGAAGGVGTAEGVVAVVAVTSC